MDRLCIDSVQNRFTAYLVTAVTNKKIKYMNHKKRLREMELVRNDILEKNCLDFEKQYHRYIVEQTDFLMEDWEQFQEMLVRLQSENLMRAIKKLKERDIKILFARVFGELTFSELGEKFNMSPKQVEMAYYYVIRKLRKELEVGKNEF